MIHFVGFSLKASPIYGGLGLIVGGGIGFGIVSNFWWIIFRFNGVFYLFRGDISGIGYLIALATEQFPEVWISNKTVLGAFLSGFNNRVFNGILCF